MIIAAEKLGSNYERTNNRDMTLSACLRNVGDRPGKLTDNVRHKDNDFTQHCARCNKAIVFFEGSTDPKKATTYIRQMSEDTKHNSVAIKLIHYPHDVRGIKGLKQVVVWVNGRTKKVDATDVQWVQVYEMLEQIQLGHANSSDCKKAKAFR